MSMLEQISMLQPTEDPASEQIFLQKTAEKDELKKAFQMLDVGQTLTVTKGEFRGVVETFLFHLTEAELDAVLAEIEQPQLPNNDINSAGISAQGESMLTRLCSAHQDIEKAFRAIDVRWSGFVSLDYLKSVINGFIFPLPNETFQKLMSRFLKTTGKIAWQPFLEKFWDPGSTFEKRQTIPMSEKHKVNPARGDEAFSSDTVVQKLHRYFQDAYPSLKQACLMLDKRDGKITRNDLHHVFMMVFKMKDKDFQELIEIIDPEQTGYLDYHEFDLFELKSISNLDEKQLQAECLGVLLFHVLSGDATSINVPYPVEKADYRVIHDKAYVDRQENIIISGTGQELEDHDMPMDDSQFNLQTEELRLPDGVSYLDFVAILEDARLNGPGATLCTSPNHRVNDAKYHYLTAEECLNQINDKLMAVYGDTYSAFRETDSNRDGAINMLDFQQFLDSFARDEEFLHLLGLLVMHLTSMLNYQEFCQLFHTQETKEVPPHLVPSQNITVGSDVRKKEMITDAELACDHAHYYLVIKARTRWHDLARNFQEFDNEGNGIIESRDLKKVLFRFGIPITPEEFKQLWARYDTDAKGYLTRQEFLQKLGIDFAPAVTGLSRHIKEDSYAHLQAHYNNQQKKHSKLEKQQKQQTEALHVREIKKQIKDKFRDYFQDFNKAFHKVDKNRGGYGTVCDLHRMLQGFNYYLHHDQFSSLLNSSAGHMCSGYTNAISLARLIKQATACPEENEPYGLTVELLKGSKAGYKMSPGPQTTSFFRVMLRIPQILHCWRPVETFKSCYESHTGLLHIADFGQVLPKYSIDLTEQELFNILEYYDKTLSSKISYNDFLQAFIQ
ncbi:LOW QUALITY PROTEIN: EF-hand calcium-binding domain-containing protein 6 [Podargus strigoides]